MISPSDYTNDLPRPTGPVKTIRLDSDDNVFIADAISFLTGETIDESNRTLRSILSQDYDIEISEVNERAPDGNFFKHPICEAKNIIRILELCNHAKIDQFKDAMYDCIRKHLSGEKMMSDEIYDDEKMSGLSEVKRNQMSPAEVAEFHKHELKMAKLRYDDRYYQRNHELTMQKRDHELQVLKHEAEDRRFHLQLRYKENNSKRAHEVRVMAHENQFVIDQNKIQNDALANAAQIIDTVDCPTESSLDWSRDSKRHCASALICGNSINLDHPSIIPIPEVPSASASAADSFQIEPAPTHGAIKNQPTERKGALKSCMMERGSQTHPATGSNKKRVRYASSKRKPKTIIVC